jgi:hypothetical protein
MRLLGGVISTVAIATAWCAILLALAGFIGHPGGSHWDTQKRIAYALSQLGMMFAIASLVACIFTAAHRRYEPDRSSGRLKWAVALAAIGLVIAALTPPI